MFSVDSIDDSMSPRSTFEKNDKGVMIKISYMEYYKKNYGLDIMDPDQPMLISRYVKKKIFICINAKSKKNHRFNLTLKSILC